MSGPTEGLARSVHDRVVRYAKAEGLDPTAVFARYGLERFLYRLSRSAHTERFVLKGALLLRAWLGEAGRPTRDADFLGLGDLSETGLLEMINDVCRQSVDDDAMTFDPASIRVDVIRADDAYGGRRASLFGTLGSGRIRIQIDVGVGDATVPEPAWLELPSLLEMPRPRLRAYRPETVVAEKLHAIVHLGEANTRLKDFYDLFVLGRTQRLDDRTLRRAIQATFERRQTEVPKDVPSGLRPDFASNARRGQWTAFARRHDLRDVPELPDALAEIRDRIGALTWNRADDP